MNAPKPSGFRGPFSRWPRVCDALLAALLFLTTACLTEGPGDTMVTRPIGSVPVLVLFVTAVAAATLYVRRRMPLVMLAVVVVVWASLVPTRQYDLGFIMVVALYSVGRYVADLLPGLIATALPVAVLVIEGVARKTAWGETAFGAAALVGIWYVGRQVGLRGERAAQRHRLQQTEVARIVAEERTHIARELHDVIAHQVSMMTIQAGAAQAVAASDPEAAVQAMAAVELAGRQALDELRHLLGVLRLETERNGVGPQPGLKDLPRLVDQVRAAGLDIEVSDSLKTALPIRVQLSAYRIIQEALTNVLKHGGRGTRAEVHLRENRDDLTIEVLDHAAPGPARPPRPDSIATGAGFTGHGIIGMRERATLLGGSLDTGRRSDGGFRVVARLPLTGEPA
jgi:signal transduction histidine kinase